MSLPVPQRARWQPLRGGLLNLYLYEDLELRYEDGRLLLRGNNGTGKSRILALQLPFLLDGEISPARLEPDGDPSKRIEWHLLMDGKYADRVGYTWLELGRLDEDGTPRFVTLGCGMKAVQGKGAPSKWFFVTDQRVGVDLRLQDSQRVPFKRAPLEERIGTRGRVLRKASEYRAAVDDALFGLGEQRYAALLDLLIQLRRPQLSRKLDAGQLSDALSRALPPLSESTLGDVAEAFRSLENDRHRLEERSAALEATDAFTKSYRGYVRMATRRRAQTARTAHSGYEHAGRALRAAEHQLEEADAQRERNQVALDDVERRLAEASAASRELERDPAHRDATRLADLFEQAERAREESARATHEREQAAAEKLRSETGRVAAVAKHEAQEAGLKAAVDAAEGKAHALGLDALASALDPAAAMTRVTKRRREVEHLERHAAARDRARAELERARERATTAKTELDRAVEQRVTRQGERDEAREQLETALELWSDELRVLSAPPLGDVLEALADWTEHGDGDGPVSHAVGVAYRTALSMLASERALLDGDHTRATERRDALIEERRGLERGNHIPPLAPAWRDPEARAAREGAPLWAVTDFHESVSPEDRAGYEAALEASGILDAWIDADGHVFGVDDAFLVPGSDVTHGRSLTSVLRPSIDERDRRSRALSPDVVERVLACIGAEPIEGTAWVAADGRFELGPLTGRSQKDAVEHIGHAAREATRRRRIEDLSSALDALDAELRAIDANIGEHRRRAEQAELERSAAPTELALRDAVRALASAERDARARAERHRETGEACAVATSAFERAHAELVRDAEDLGLERWIDRVGELRRALSELEAALPPVWAALHVLGALRERLDEAMATDVRAADALASKREREREATQRAVQSEASHRALKDTVGAKVDELQRRLAAARAAVKDHDRTRSQRLDERRGIDERRGRARNAVDTGSARVRVEDEARLRTFEQLQALGRTGVWPLVAERWRELDTSAAWSPTRSVEIARDLEKDLEGVAADDTHWDRANTAIQQRVQDLTTRLSSHELHPVTEYQSDLLVVTTLYQGQALGPDALGRTLREEIASRQRILDEREREILENLLLADVASHLHHRIREGERLVATMNREVESRPLSTGMRLRFRWVPREEPGLVEVRKRLLAAQGIWSPDDRRAIGAFLQQRIEEERSTRETGTWLEHLEHALDYRRWHEFHIERFQNQTWKRLTTRTYGTGSGGEKAIALTLPQLAAAAAHYQSASPHAPRLILLDEAFVGVDADMRAKCMGLLTAFELDFVMTSEREWGCYATVPALAIYQLVTRPGLDAVHETRWVWNGSTRTRDSAAGPAHAIGAE